MMKTEGYIDSYYVIQMMKSKPKVSVYNRFIIKCVKFIKRWLS